MLSARRCRGSASSNLPCSSSAPARAQLTAAVCTLSPSCELRMPRARLNTASASAYLRWASNSWPRWRSFIAQSQSLSVADRDKGVPSTRRTSASASSMRPRCRSRLASVRVVCVTRASASPSPPAFSSASACRSSASLSGLSGSTFASAFCSKSMHGNTSSPVARPRSAVASRSAAREKRSKSSNRAIAKLCTPAACHKAKPPALPPSSNAAACVMMSSPRAACTRRRAAVISHSGAHARTASIALRRAASSPVPAAGRTTSCTSRCVDIPLTALP
mmetsp:Transcript_15789/g.54886  ORF Transcript_15789/g.54886 Transcript_15789/m.54886 type:complete len:277 (-) Transcript_15789:365-1195(-)